MENLLQFAIYRLSFILFSYVNCKFGRILYYIFMEGGDTKIRHISKNLTLVPPIETLTILPTLAACS